MIQLLFVVGLGSNAEQAQKHWSLVGANLLQSSHTALEQKAESEKGGVQVNMSCMFTERILEFLWPSATLPCGEQAQKHWSLVGANLLQSSHTALEQKAESEKGGVQVNMYIYIYMHIKSSMICLMNSRGKKQANLTENNLLEVWRFVDYITHEDIIGNLPN